MLEKLKLKRTTGMTDKYNKEIFIGDILDSKTSGVFEVILSQNDDFYLREISEGLGEEIPMRQDFVKTLYVLKC